VMDALTGIYYQDDSQVIHIFASKKYVGKNDAPGVTITIICQSVKEEC